MCTKKLLILISIIGLSFGASGQKYEFVAMDNNPETKLCVNIGNNDVSKMKRSIKQIYDGTHSVYRSRSRVAANNITCNDLSLAKFAYKYEAVDTFKYINRFSSKSNKVKGQTFIRDITVNNLNDKPIKVMVMASPN